MRITARAFSGALLRAVHCVKLRRDFGPAADLLSLLVQRKEAKKHTPTSSSAVVTADALRCSVLGCEGELATRLRRCAQTTPSGQMWKHAARATPNPVLLGEANGAPVAGPGSWLTTDAMRPRRAGTVKRFSRPLHRTHSASARRGHAVPVVLHEPGFHGAPLAPPRSTGLRAARAACFVKPTGWPLSDRSGQRPRRELGHPARSPSTAGNPSRSEGRRRRGVLSLPSFFAQAKKEGRPPGRIPGAASRSESAAGQARHPTHSNCKP
jgi:hypothetical protein